jgi:hypothetical protein
VALLASSWSHRSRIGGLPGLRAIEKFDIGSNRLLALLDADDPYSFGRAVEAHTVDLFVPHVHEGKPGRPLRLAVRPASTEGWNSLPLDTCGPVAVIRCWYVFHPARQRISRPD